MFVADIVTGRMSRLHALWSVCWARDTVRVLTVLLVSGHGLLVTAVRRLRSLLSPHAGAVGSFLENYNNTVRLAERNMQRTGTGAPSSTWKLVPNTSN